MSKIKIKNVEVGVVNAPLESFESVVTPAQAKAFLENNKSNRNLRPSWVNYLAGCITRGEWTVTHQGIALAPDGTLLDGQHRLHAIVQANVAVPMMITFNVPPAAFAAMDRTKARTVGDVLRLPGGTVGLINAIHRIETDRFGYTDSLSPGQAEAVYLKHRDQIEAVMNCNRSKINRANVSTRLACFARVKAGQADYALPAFTAFTKLDFENMPKICMALLKQIDRGHIGIRDGERELIIRTWIALDPKRADLDTITYKDTELNWREIVAAIKG